MRKYIIVTLLVICGCQRQKSDITVTEVERVGIKESENFFSEIANKQLKSAQVLERLLQTNVGINQLDSGSLFLKEAFVKINENSGSFRGYNLMKKKIIGKSIAVFSYLAKYEKNYYRYIFFYYDNGKTIKLSRFLLDSDIDQELISSLKLYD